MEAKWRCSRPNFRIFKVKNMDFFSFPAFALIHPWALPISTQPQEKENSEIPIIKNEL